MNRGRTTRSGREHGEHGAHAVALVAVAAVALGAACVTAPSRPTLLDLPPGAPLTAPLSLEDADPDEGVVDVRLVEVRPALIELPPGAALVVRIPRDEATTPRTFVLDDDSQSSVTASSDADSVWLLAPQGSRALGIRASDAPTRLEALVVARSGAEATERVLFLDDTTDGIERLHGLGNVVRVNGQRRPTLTVGRGAKERWHFANTSAARTFVLVLPGHLFAVVDGQAIGEIVLAPGAVASADVELGNEADAFDLVTLDAAGDVSGEAWPLIHVVTKAPIKEDS